MKLLVPLSSLLISTYASFCGDSAVPFSFEALPDGQPVLGCARPSCFGWNENGLPASKEGNFYRINKRPDGFMRNDRQSVPPFGDYDFRRERPMIAQCEQTFQSNSCDVAMQWAGGIAPLLNVSAFPTVLQCCSYEVLRLSTDRGVAVVSPGQIVVGGEVMKNGKQYAFDYIADIMKTINSDGTVSYDVSVRRMPCMPLPDDSRKITGQNGFRAYQSSNIEQEPINIDGMDGQSEAVEGPFENDQNAFVEQTIGEDAAQIPEPSALPLDAAPAPAPGATVQFYQAVPVYGDVQEGAALPQTLNLPQAPPPMQAPIGPQPVMQAIPQPVMQPVMQPVQPIVAQPVAPVAPQAPVVPASVPAYYYPTYYSGGGGYYCFTDDTEVELGDGSFARMDELKKGSWVKTIEGGKVGLAPVSFWMHRVPKQDAEFVKLTLEDGTSLKLTGKHYIYKTKCGARDSTPDAIDNVPAVFAELVNEGDCVYKVSKDNTIYESKVIKTEIIKQQGIYAPMTSNGKLIVNGIYASCHNIVQHHELQRSFFSYLDYANDLINQIFSWRNVNEIPYGMQTVVYMMEIALPKQLF